MRSDTIFPSVGAVVSRWLILRLLGIDLSPTDIVLKSVGIDFEDEEVWVAVFSYDDDLMPVSPYHLRSVKEGGTSVHYYRYPSVVAIDIPLLMDVRRYGLTPRLCQRLFR